jgi:hypothetical protein
MTWELRDDALQSDQDGFLLRIGLPWMRSLPLSCLLDLSITIDGEPLATQSLRVVIDQDRIPLPELSKHAERWWFVQDRLPLTGPHRVRDGGRYHVAVTLVLLLPYLTSRPGRPATLPFRFDRELTAGLTIEQGAWHDVGTARPPSPPPLEKEMSR